MIILRIKYKKEQNMKFLSHLELIKTMERAFRRMKLPMAFSQGFNPKPKISYAAPLPVGVEGECEFLDVELTEKIDLEVLIKDQKTYLPKGIEFLEARHFGKMKSLMSVVTDSTYLVHFLTKTKEDKEHIEGLLNDFVSQESITYEKVNKKKKVKQVDIKPLIGKADVLLVTDEQVILKLQLTTGSNGNLKPEKFTELFLEHSQLELQDNTQRYRRLELFARDKFDQLVTLFEV
jgi:radical SAM-linked protein